MIRCRRCDEPAPLPPHVHAQHVGDGGGDPELPILYPVPRSWFPADDDSGIVCLACASDDEINDWITSPAFHDSSPGDAEGD